MFSFPTPQHSEKLMKMTWKELHLSSTIYLLMSRENLILNKGSRACRALETNKITVLWVLDPLVWSQIGLRQNELLSYIFA